MVASKKFGCLLRGPGCALPEFLVKKKRLVIIISSMVGMRAEADRRGDNLAVTVT